MKKIIWTIHNRIEWAMNQREHGSTSTMNLDPSQGQYLNQDFIKSTTSMAFMFFLSCALKQMLQVDVLDDCVARI